MTNKQYTGTAVSSANRFAGWSTIYRVANDPYMTRVWFGRLRLHIFHRGDEDPDPHDHPWGFWTFPLTSYVEEVTYWKDQNFSEVIKIVRVVKAFRLHYRPATHTHRVLGRWTGQEACGVPSVASEPGRMITIVWRGSVERAWGFFKTRDGRSCWVVWREYVFGGGKSAPCE